MGEAKTHEDVLELWNTIKRIVDANDTDLVKNATPEGNCEAGIRVRHTLRLLRKRALELTYMTRDIDKAIVKRRREQRKSKGE